MARLSERYDEVLIVVRTPHGKLLWKSTDKTWSLGAMMRYMNCVDEMDRMDERQQIMGSIEDVDNEERG